MSRVQLTLNTVQRLLGQGKKEESRQTLQRALQRDPGDPALANAMAVTLVALEQYEQALFFAQKAAKALPNEGEALSTHGSVLALLGRNDEAIPILEKAMTLAPRSVNPRLGLTNALTAKNLHSRVVDVCLETLKLHPGEIEVTTKLVMALLNCGRAEEASQAAQNGLNSLPEDLNFASFAAFAVNYLPDPSPADVLAAHRRYGQIIERCVAQAGITPAVPRPASARPATAGKAGRIRVGFVSPDFRTHSVAFFVEPLIRELDRTRYEVFCFSTSRKEDRTTERFKKLADVWQPLTGISEPEIDSRIRTRNLDVLIDLAGHTNDNCLPVLARKPAPVQATYCGYPATTGLKAVDYRIVDWLTDPAGSESAAVEKLIRIADCFLCYQPVEDAPPCAPPPSTTGAPITFGSFNTLLKLNRRVIAAWVRLLSQVPGSRLLLKATQLADPRIREDTIRRFSEAGLDAARIEVLPATAGQAEHLAVYSRLDVALDPFPYAGTTTTCEAMWMGVPVVTLAGGTHASRVGVSLLTNVGLPELITHDDDAYVKVAADLARDTTRLVALRTGLRDRMRASPLCDPKGFAARFGAVIEAMAAGPAGP